MKNILKIITFICAFFASTICVFAKVDMYASKTSINLYLGETATFTLTVEEAAGKVNFKSNNTSIATISPNGDMFLDKESQTVMVTPQSVGSTSITIKAIDVTGYDKALTELTGKTINIVVNVVNKPTTTTTTTTSKKQNDSTTNTTTTTTKNNIEEQKPSSTTTKSNNNPATSEETTTTVTTTQIINNAYLSNIEIVGYNLDFEKNKEEYTINIDENVKEIYLTAASEEYPTNQISTQGIINIDGKDNVVVSVTDEYNNTRNYNINIVRNNITNNSSNSDFTKYHMFYLLIIMMLIIINTYTFIRSYYIKGKTTNED